MRLGLVSTYPPRRCAIGIYSQKLARAVTAEFDDVEVSIIAERGAERHDENRLSAAPYYGREDEYGDAIVAAVAERDCDVVHLQYAPDLFGEDERFPKLVERLHTGGLRTVLTLHTVYDARLGRRLVGKPTTRWFHRALARHSDRIIVHHHEGMATKLVDQGVGRDRIAVIPHGTTVLDLPEQSESRRRIGLDQEGSVLTFFGFIHRYKNVHTVVEAFLRVADELPSATLLVAGMPWGDRWYNRLYLDLIKARVRSSRHAKRVVFRDDYLADEDVPHVYACSDVILLPHNQRYGSASGVFHQAVGAGRPVLVARGPKFEDAQHLFRNLPELCVHPNRARSWAQAMRNIVTDATLRERSRRAVADYAQSTAWPAVARLHMGVYRSG